MTVARNIILTAKTGSIIINCGTDNQGVFASDSIILAAENGSITINGSANSAGMTAAHNILLSAGETSESSIANITLNTFVTSSTGNISVHAKDSIIQMASGDVTVNAVGATIDMSADADITMADGAISATNNGAIRYEATNGSITLGGLNAGTAQVSLVSGGSILDGGDANVDIIATDLRIFAGGGAGTRANYLETTVTTVSAHTVSGGLFLTESSDVVIGAVAAVTVNRVKSDGSSNASTIVDAAQSDLTSGGDIIVQTTNGTITTLVTSGDVSAVGTVRLQAGGTNSNINQNATINAHDVIVAADSTILMAATASTTTTTGGSVLYDAGKNIAVASISAASGVVTLKVGVAGEITDSGNDAQVNITANALNVIGHGVVNTSAKPDETTLAAMRSQAIETKVDRVFVASYSNTAAKLDYQIGQNVTGVLRENNGWSLQFVNDGFFVPTKTLVASSSSPSSVISATNVDSWQYTRDLNFQLLEYLAAKSEVVRTQSQTVSVPTSGKIVPTDLVLFKQTARIADVELKRTSPSIETGVRVDLFGHNELNADVLGIDGSGIIPTFGTAAYDQILTKGTHEPLMFEYWIENMMF